MLGHLTRRNAGLSTRYAEWPGATRMLIPLAAPARKGSLAALGADELTSEGVIGQLRSQPDRGLEPRKEMVELKERQVAEEKAGLEERRGELETRREEQARQERALQEERRAQEAREEQAATPQEKEEAARGRRELETREAELAAQRAETARQETEAAGRAEAVAGRERALEAERQGIVRDERAQPFQPAAAAAAGPAEAPGYYSDKLYYLWARGNGPDGLPLRALSVLDPFTAGVHRTSPVTGIVSPAYSFFQGGILVAARPAPGQAGRPGRPPPRPAWCCSTRPPWSRCAGARPRCTRRGWSSCRANRSTPSCAATGTGSWAASTAGWPSPPPPRRRSGRTASWPPSAPASTPPTPGGASWRWTGRAWPARRSSSKPVS